MSETPIYGLRDQVAPHLDSALHAVSAKGENFAWEVAYTMMMTQMGPQPQAILVLTGPSPILGSGSLIASRALDLRELLDPGVALDQVRQMVEFLRKLRADMLSMDANPNGGGGLQLPGW